MKQPMIPSQPSDRRSEFARFDAFAKKLLAVPKAAIDRQEKKTSKRRRKV